MGASELQRLESISEKSLYLQGIMPTVMAHCFQVLRRHLVGTSVLEMGPAEGVMTGLLAATGLELTVVEGSALFCAGLRDKFPGIQVAHSLFEDFEPKTRFDNIVMGHVLEHVESPVGILTRAASWLKPGGRVFSAAPNARSLHRQAAVVMGLLPREDALNDLDRHHGHRRVFTPESLRNTFLEAGFRVEVFGGYFLKPISNGQIEDHWNPAMLDAFLQLGERYPDIAGEIYVVASHEPTAQNWLL